MRRILLIKGAWVLVEAISMGQQLAFACAIRQHVYNVVTTSYPLRLAGFSKTLWELGGKLTHAYNKKPLLVCCAVTT